MIENVLRGADPELFLRNKTTGLPVTSIGRVGGTKDNPRPIISTGYALQEDNVAVEFNIPPAPTKAIFVASLQIVLEHLTNEMALQDLQLDISPTMEFDFFDLLHPQAQTLGCDPDYNAWTGKKNPRPTAPETLRSSGGHLHIGYNNPDDKTSIEIIKAHDLFCGVVSLTYDDDNQRRTIYGKAGAHRIKKYGVEYRTLSNAWLRTPELMELIYEQSEKAVDFVNKGNTIDEEWGVIIQNTINNGDSSGIELLNKQFAIL
jgi:hypothetical protein